MISLGNIVSGFSFPQDYYAVEHYTGTPDGDLFKLVHLKTVKGEVNLESCRMDRNLSTLLKEVDTAIPVILLVNGRKVLTKTQLVNDTSGFDSEELIMRAYPNINIEDMEYQTDYMADNQLAISIIRKDIVLNTKSELEKLGFRLVDVVLGAYGLISMLGLDENKAFHLGFQYVNPVEKTIKTAETESTEDIVLWEQKLDSVYALSFTLALKILVEKRFIASKSYLLNARRDWKFQRLFKFSLVISAAALFVVLLLSFFMLSHYESKNNQLSTNTLSYQEQLKMVNELKDAYYGKVEFLDVNGGGFSSFSLMTDQIGSIVPKGVTLRKLRIFPLEKKLKKQNLVRFYRDELHLEGETENYSQFQNWFTKIKRFDWVEDIEVVGYQEHNNKHKADFSIKILIKE